MLFLLFKVYYDIINKILGAKVGHVKNVFESVLYVYWLFFSPTFSFKS